MNNFLERCEEVLHNEGYRTENLGGIALGLKVNGMGIVIFSHEEDKNFLKMDLRFKEVPAKRQELFEIANAICEGRKVAKMYIEDDNSICITTEILLDNSPQLADVLPRLVDILQGTARIVLDKVQQCS